MDKAEWDREYRKSLYHERISKGLCGRCGKENNSRFHSCDKCREYLKETRRVLFSLGICPKCGKNKLYAKQRVCEICSAKSYESNRRFKDKKKAGITNE